MNSNTKTIVVTGSNRGIGYSYVEMLLQYQKENKHPKHKIIMTARDMQKGEISFKKLIQQYPNSDLHLEQLDVAEEKCINQFYEMFKEKYKNLDLLVNNAGVLATGDVGKKDFQTQENIDFILSINFYGVVNLSEKLLPLLTKNGKIVSVSSRCGLLKHEPEEGRKILSDPNLTTQKMFEIAKDYKDACQNKTMKNWHFSTYFFSKALVNAYHRFVMPKLLKNDQLSFSLCPGYCKTDMGNEAAKIFPCAPNLTPEQGAAHVLFVTIEIPFKANDKQNGSFFLHGSKEPSQF